MTPFTTLVDFSIILVFAFINATLTYFLQFCFRDGAIFEKWLPFLAKNTLKKRDKNMYDIISRMPAEKRDYEFIQAASDYFWFKILGGCYVCSNVWQSFGTFGIVYFICSVNIFWGIPFVLISNFLLRKMWNDEKD